MEDYNKRDWVFGYTIKYTYDNLNRIKTRQKNSGDIQTYHYDDLGRLIQIDNYLKYSKRNWWSGNKRNPIETFSYYTDSIA